MCVLNPTQDDFVNKTFGGIAAGGVVAHVWFPTRPTARLALTSTGAFVSGRMGINGCGW